MWIKTSKKWNPNSVEARIYKSVWDRAKAEGASGTTAGEEAMEAVFRAMHWMYGHGQKATVKLIKEAFGVKTSSAALSGFWDRFASPFLEERMRRNSTMARLMAGELDSDAVQQAASDKIAEEVFEILSNPNPDHDKVAKLARVLQGDRKLDQGERKLSVDERKIALLEAKAAFADEVKKAAANREGGLTAEDMEEIERRLKIL